MQRRILTLVALLMFAVLAMGATQSSRTKAVKQAGGSTGDSLAAAADTSQNVLTISKKATAFWVVVYADSLMSYRTQVSPDNSNWFTIDFDSCAIGESEATADFGSLYAGMFVRVITDMLVADAGGTPVGSAYVYETK